MTRAQSSLIPLALLVVMTIHGCDDSTTKPPANRYPVLVSLTVAPDSITTTDSATVTCVATDADGDTLVYDWDVDSRLRISGNPPGIPIKSNTLNNAEVFYLNYNPTTVDSVWVVCTTRDRMGGSATRSITLFARP